MDDTRQSFGETSTSDRVPEYTSEQATAQIRLETLRRLEQIGQDQMRIETRLNEIETEWDIERALQANAAAVSLTGVLLGMTGRKSWFVLPGVVAGFLMQHAVQGWCPPAALLRRMGFRTQREIDNERAILKARRGDLDGLATGDSEKALHSLEF